MNTRAHQTVRRYLSLVLVTVIVSAALGIQPASAEDPIAFSVDKMLIDRPGTLIKLTTVGVDPSHVGQLCTVRVESHNQASVHNGNDLVITSGNVAAVIPNVEAEADASIDLSVQIVLGRTIDVDLRMGPDWVSSLGFALWLDCATTAPILQPDLPAGCPDQSAAADSPPVDTDNGQIEASPPKGSDVGSVDGQTGCLAPVEPEPAEVGPKAVPSELPTLPPRDQPAPCVDPTVGSLSIVPDDCPEPAAPQPPAPVEPAPVEPTPPAPADPTPQPQPDTAAKPTNESAGAGGKSSTKPAPEVLGLQVERLPLTPAAPAVPGAPRYNG